MLEVTSGRKPSLPTLSAVIRSMRLLRIVRLAKLFMSRRALMGLEVYFVHKTGMPALVFALVVVYWFFFLANLMACVFIGTANSEGMCRSWVLQLASTDGLSLPDCGATVRLPSEVTVYVSALYFATMTLTTVGYGDIVGMLPIPCGTQQALWISQIFWFLFPKPSIRQTAKTNTEKSIVVVFMLISAFFMATVTGNMVAVLSKHSQGYAREQTFKDKMALADQWLGQHPMPVDTRHRILAWFEQAYFPHESRCTDDGTFLLELPAPLRAAAVEAIVGRDAMAGLLRGVLCADTQVWLMARLIPVTLHALHTLFVVGERPNAVYILVRGQLTVLHRGLVVTLLSAQSSAVCFGGRTVYSSLLGDVAPDASARGGAAGGAAEPVAEGGETRADSGLGPSPRCAPASGKQR